MQKEAINPMSVPYCAYSIFTITSLEDITEEDLRQYWPACASHADRLCCQSEFGWSTATLRISYAGIQHFFGRTLVRSWNIFNEIKWKCEQTLPTILSLQEVRKIIYALPTLQSHTFYLILYSLGLRLREATTLQVRDILSDRGLVLHIHAGKGGWTEHHTSGFTHIL
jgi:integrase